MAPQIQPPNGTRDLYPLEAAKRRFITEAWRRVSINHGFEEIDGPTFEHLELYTVKSGEGIVSELFSFRREGGEKDFALRPEFTPTLARMYAARAKSLPSPTKWFTAGPFFRAERPQRGRLREFLQWNCDVIGLALPEKATAEDIHKAKAIADADAVAAVVGLMRELGLTPQNLKVRIGYRDVVVQAMLAEGLAAEKVDTALRYLDRKAKLPPADFVRGWADQFGFSYNRLESGLARIQEDIELGLRDGFTGTWQIRYEDMNTSVRVQMQPVIELVNQLRAHSVNDWCTFDLSIVRGLAYYTGMVFEVIVDGERAVAGGGRYDNLIEMFGGPSTPAVGFGMGDVVLSLVLQDKGLMPSDAELLELAGLRPDVFVISNGTPEADARVGGVVAELRRGVGERIAGSESRPTQESRPTRGLHVRRSYKATKKIGKLLQEAGDVRAKFAVILESGTEATIKNLQTGEQDQSRTAIEGLGAELRRRLG